jgi:hypothetical protein
VYRAPRRILSNKVARPKPSECAGVPLFLVEDPNKTTGLLTIPSVLRTPLWGNTQREKKSFFGHCSEAEVGDVGPSRRKLPKIGRSDDKRTRSISRYLYKLIKIALDFRIVKGWLLDFFLLQGLLEYSPCSG